MRRRRLLLGLGLGVAGFGAIALLLGRDDWNWARPAVAWAASRATGRAVALSDLRVDFGRVLDVRVRDLDVANPPWAEGASLFHAASLGVRLRLLPLLVARFELERITAEHATLALERDADGRANWSFGRGGGGGDVAIPGDVRLDDFDFSFTDPRRPRGFALAVDALRSRTVGAVHAVRGRGVYQEEPVALDAAFLGLPRPGSGPTLARFRLVAGGTRAVARGRIGDGGDSIPVDLDLVADGQSLADFWRLFGLPLPATPAFHVDGELAYRRGRFDLTRFHGRLGKSDVAGDLAIRLADPAAGGRLFLDADVRSRAVDLDDIEGFWGRRPREEPHQPDVPAGAVTSVFPDLPFSFPKLRVADADVRFRAGKVLGETVLDHVRLDATLRDGVLRLAPLGLGMSAGKLEAVATIDASRDVTRLDADLTLRGVELEELLRRAGLDERGRGTFGGRASIRSAGNSLHELARHLDGEVGTALREGSLSDPLLELVALHLGDYLFARLGHHEATPIRCLVGVFDGEDGVLDARTLVLDTKHVRIEGEGTVDLGHEKLDLELDQHAKDLSFGALRTPIRIEGRFTDREAHLEAGPLVARGGAAVALGAAIHPLAALLALVDPGKDDRPNVCEEALADYRPIAAELGKGEGGESAPLPKAAPGRRAPDSGPDRR